MFPNVRVMIVALLASMVGVGCGLGALAVLRVNHQPFTRAQSGEPPLQLAYGTGTPTLVSDGTPSPFGVRFEVKEPPSPRVTVAVPASPEPPVPPALSADDPAVKRDVQPEADPNAKSEPKPAPNAASSQDDVDAIVAGLIPDPAPAEVAPPRTFAPVQTAEPVEDKLAQIAVPAEPKPVQMAIPVQTAPAQVVSPAEPTLAAKPQAADRPMTTAAIVPDSAAAMPARSEALTRLPSPEPAAPKNEVRHHAAKRAKRARPASTVSADSNFAAPTYQPFLGTAAETPFIAQAAQPAPRRLVVKRRHHAKKAATQATSTTPDTVVAPATVATTKR